MNYESGSNWLAWSETRLNKLVNEIARADRIITSIASTNQSIQVKAGFIAEEIHSLTFNADGIFKGRDAEAYTDRHENFSDFGLLKFCPSDIVIANEYVTLKAQVKFYSSAQRTAAALREIRSGVHVYSDMLHVAPAEQVAGVVEAARKTMLRERAKAHRLTVANAAKYVMNTVSDRIELNGVSSMPLTLDQARDIANQPHGETFYSFVEYLVYNAIYEIMKQRHLLGAPHGISPFPPDASDSLLLMEHDAEYIAALKRTRSYVAHCASSIPPIPTTSFDF